MGPSPTSRSQFNEQYTNPLPFDIPINIQSDDLLTNLGKNIESKSEATSPSKKDPSQVALEEYIESKKQELPDTIMKKMYRMLQRIF